MNFLSMKYFTAVARARSFTRAASELKITQQTLSAHIAGVEKELGCALFVRHVPLELTYAGEVFLRYASSFQKNYEQALSELSDIGARKKGKIKVGVGFTRGMAIMPDIICEFQKAWPDYEVELVEVSNEELTERLAGGDLDLAVATFPEDAVDIEVRPFYREEIVLAVRRSLLAQVCAAPRDEVAGAVRRGDLSHLASCPFVLGKPEDISGAIALDFLQKNSLHPVVKARSDNIGTLLELCLRGVGACFCQSNFIHLDMAPENLAKLELLRLPSSASYEIRFGMPKLAYHRKVVRDFMATALDVSKSSRDRMVRDMPY